MKLKRKGLHAPGSLHEILRFRVLTNLRTFHLEAVVWRRAVNAKKRISHDLRVNESFLQAWDVKRSNVERYGFVACKLTESPERLIHFLNCGFRVERPRVLLHLLHEETFRMDYGGLCLGVGGRVVDICDMATIDILHDVVRREVIVAVMGRGVNRVRRISRLF